MKSEQPWVEDHGVRDSLLFSERDSNGCGSSEAMPSEDDSIEIILDAFTKFSWVVMQEVKNSLHILNSNIKSLLPKWEISHVFLLVFVSLQFLLVESRSISSICMLNTEHTDPLRGQLSAEARGNVSVSSDAMREDANGECLVGCQELRCNLTILNRINLSILKIVEHLFRPLSIDEHAIDC